MDSFESLPCGCITEEQTGKHSLCKHLENLVFWSYNVQEKRGSMKKLTLENWQELQPYIALADYHEYNSNTVTMLMWTPFSPSCSKCAKAEPCRRRTQARYPELYRIRCEAWRKKEAKP